MIVLSHLRLCFQHIYTDREPHSEPVHVQTTGTFIKTWITKTDEASRAPKIIGPWFHPPPPQVNNMYKKTGGLELRFV